MKKLFYIFLILVTPLFLFSQNVGIGVDSPMAKLHVAGSSSDATIPGDNSGSILRLGTSATEGLNIGKRGNGTNDLWLQAGSSGIADPLSIQPLGGNVGIGIISPTEKLHVNGNIKITGTITGVSDPINAEDAANKSYVDGMKASFNEDLLDAGLNGVVQDIDGNKYKTIKIGTQVWMVDNLKTTHYNNGTAIQKVTIDTVWQSLSSPAYSWYDNDSIQNSKLLGALYNYYSISDTNSLNVCPVGWDVPTDTDLTELEVFLENNGYGFDGSGVDFGKALASRYLWTINTSPGAVGNDPGTNNQVGFSGFPAGFRNSNGTFTGIENYAIWWSSTAVNAEIGWYRYLYFGNDYIQRSFFGKAGGLSVRCIRD